MSSIVRDLLRKSKSLGCPGSDDGFFRTPTGRRQNEQLWSLTPSSLTQKDSSVKDSIDPFERLGNALSGRTKFHREVAHVLRDVDAVKPRRQCLPAADHFASHICESKREFLRPQERTIDQSKLNPELAYHRHCLATRRTLILAAISESINAGGNPFRELPEPESATATVPPSSIASSDPFCCLSINLHGPEDVTLKYDTAFSTHTHKAHSRNQKCTSARDAKKQEKKGQRVPVKRGSEWECCRCRFPNSGRNARCQRPGSACREHSGKSEDDGEPDDEVGDILGAIAGLFGSGAEHYDQMLSDNHFRCRRCQLL